MGRWLLSPWITLFKPSLLEKGVRIWGFTMLINNNKETEQLGHYAKGIWPHTMQVSTGQASNTGQLFPTKHSFMIAFKLKQNKTWQGEKTSTHITHGAILKILKWH